MQEVLKNLPILETDHFILRKINTKDIYDIYHYGSNPSVSKYVTWETHKTKEDTEAFVASVIDGYNKNNKALWGMEIKDTKTIIGTIDFVSINEADNNAEIGYVLSYEYWGKGLMTEAAKKIIEFGFKELGLIRIQAKCLTENIGSQRVMEKAGMSFEGIIRKGAFDKGIYRDLKLYSILSEEFNDKVHV